MTITPIGQTLLITPLFLLLSITVSAAYQETEVVDGGAVSGKFTFSGDLPEDAVEQIAITKNPDVCGEGYREVVWIDVDNGALRNAFVFIDKIDSGKAWPTPSDGNYMIMQKGCRFHPWPIFNSANKKPFTINTLRRHLCRYGTTNLI